MSNFVLHINGQIYDKSISSKLTYTGKVKNGKAHGYGVVWVEHQYDSRNTKYFRVVFHGNFVDGLPEGQGVLYDAIV